MSVAQRSRRGGGGRGVTGAGLYPLFVVSLATRARVVGLGLLGAIGVVVGAVLGGRGDVDQLRVWTEFADAFGLSLLAPVVALLFASAALGGPAEDGTLVYLWLRPVSRLRIALAAYLASLTLVVPLVVLPLGLGAWASRAGGAAVVGTLAAATVAVVAYTALFCWLGLRVRRALAFGLAYILIWEGFVANAGATAARLAVRAHTRTILADATDVPLHLADSSPVTGAAVPLAVAVVGLLLITKRLRSTDVT